MIMASHTYDTTFCHVCQFRSLPIGRESEEKVKIGQQKKLQEGVRFEGRGEELQNKCTALWNTKLQRVFLMGLLFLTRL